ncbi:MAG: histidinol-phosphate transaminase [Pseudomonadota bacterium]
MPKKSNPAPAPPGPANTIDRVLTYARPDIRALVPYSAAGSISRRDVDVLLNANENPFTPFPASGPINRYPASQPQDLRDALARTFAVAPENLLITRGSDDGIDVIVRTFIRAGRDHAIICPPTFAMYEKALDIQGGEVRRVPLRGDDFTLDLEGIKSATDKNTKLLFLCSPNNPTGSLLDRKVMIELITRTPHPVIVDEAYIEFLQGDSTDNTSLTSELARLPNLVILRTLSKVHGLAGLRVGGVIAAPELIALLSKVMPPYPMAVPVIADALRTLADPAARTQRIAFLSAERERMARALNAHSGIERVYPSCANFLLVISRDPQEMLKACHKAGVLVRDQTHNLAGAIRISIGNAYENDRLLAALTPNNVTPSEPRTRTAQCHRRTNETDITGWIDLDQAEPVRIDTGIGFYDHMLEQVARHGGFGLVLTCRGDLHVDAHHTIEDCAIVLGQLLDQALGARHGVGRYGFTLPMDESLARVAIDLSGRASGHFDGTFSREFVGTFPTDMTRHIITSLAEHLRAAIHVQVHGEDTHHMVEACFKGLGRALAMAIAQTGDEMPSTKGTLS